MAVHVRNHLQQVLKPACLAGLSIALPAAAHAALPINPLGKPDTPPNQYVGITLSQNATYDSNPLRLVNQSKALYGSETTAALLLDSHDPMSLLQLNSIVMRGQYNDTDFNSTNIHEYLTTGRHNQHWDISLDGRFDYDTTRSTEITSFGIRAPNVRNTRYSVTPGIGYRFAPNDKIGATFNGIKSSYDNAAFIDYTSYNGSTYWKHKLDARNSVLFTVANQHYQTDEGPKSTTTTLSPTVGWVWEYSDDLTAHINVGEQKTKQDTSLVGAKDNSQWNYTYSGALTYKTQRYITDAKISRDQRPFGNGQSVLLTDLNLRESYLINDRLSARGSVGYRKATYVAAPVVTSLDDEYSASAGIAYRIMKDLDAVGTYSFTRQKLLGALPGTVTSNSVIVGVTYHPPEKAL